jgi:hypothetical protein
MNALNISEGSPPVATLCIKGSLPDKPAEMSAHSFDYINNLSHPTYLPNPNPIFSPRLMTGKTVVLWVETGEPSLL